MIPVYLADLTNGQALHLVGSTVHPKDGNILIVDTLAGAHGVWKTAQITTQTTTTIVSPIPGGAITVTDVLFSGKKVTNATADIQFSDGTNTEIFMAPDMSNAPANVPFSPKGGFPGWKDGAVQVVTAGANPTITITVVYFHVTEGLSYSEWDATRNNIR